MPGGLKTRVELALQAFPHGPAGQALDNHAAFDDFGRLRHVAGENHVLIPGGKILGACCDGRFSHNFGVFF